MQQENFSHVDPAKLQAQREYKQQKELFKSHIKDAVKEQKIIKGQANRKGGEQSGASQSSAAIQCFDLRCMYIAYAIFRHIYGGYTKFPEANCMYEITPEAGGKTLTKLVVHGRPVSEMYINDIIKKYVPKTIYTG